MSYGVHVEMRNFADRDRVHAAIARVLPAGCERPDGGTLFVKAANGRFVQAQSDLDYDDISYGHGLTREQAVRIAAAARAAGARAIIRGSSPLNGLRHRYN